MALRLIDRNATKELTLEGTRFVIRQLTGAERATIMLHFQQREDESWEADFVTLLPTLAKAVIEIKGYEKIRPLQILQDIEDHNTLMALTLELMRFSSLTEKQEGNLNSSSDGDSSNPARVAK